MVSDLEPKYKLKDKVWIFFTPDQLIDDSEFPVFECEIASCQSTIERASNGVTVKHLYEVYLGFETTWVAEDKMFSTKEEAINSGIKRMEDSISNLGDKVQTRRSSLRAMLEVISGEGKE